MVVVVMCPGVSSAVTSLPDAGSSDAENAADSQSDIVGVGADNTVADGVTETESATSSVYVQMRHSRDSMPRAIDSASLRPDSDDVRTPPFCLLT